MEYIKNYTMTNWQLFDKRKRERISIFYFIYINERERDKGNDKKEFPLFYILL